MFWGYLATSGAKSDIIFLLGDPDFLIVRQNFAPIFLSYRDPHFGLFWGVLGVFWGYLANTVSMAAGVGSGPVRMIPLHCPTHKTLYATRVLANLCLDSQLTVIVIPSTYGKYRIFC